METKLDCNKNNKENCILFSTHLINDFILSQFRRLQAEVSDWSDVFMLIHIEEDQKPVIPKDIAYCSFSMNSIRNLNFKAFETSTSILPGNNHLPVFDFFKKHSNYKYYWNIEYDVLFWGNWNAFFSCFSFRNEDFLSSHIQNREECPEWTWWPTLHFENISVNKEHFLKSFNPIYRLSNKSLMYLTKCLSEGCYGHHEALIPTLLNMSHYKIGDFGGSGPFVLPGFQERFYSSMSNKDDLWYQKSSMRYRPIYNDSKDLLIPNYLYLYYSPKFRQLISYFFLIFRP